MTNTTDNDLPDFVGDRFAALRILDANANRVQEGLRVIEEYARFVLSDSFLTRELKQIRHRLTEVLQRLPESQRMAARDTAGDVGTELTADTEFVRHDVSDVAAANMARTQQALRAIEEYAKVGWPELARQVEPLRYRLYVLGQALFRVEQSQHRLAAARLYVLVDGGIDEGDFERRCKAVLAGGAHMVQLRDKHLDDRRLLARARQLRAWSAEADAIFIMNDRPDLARLARADGVHVGQAELHVHEARAIMGPDALVGVSTHSIEQVRQAVLEGADYLGCGPTFPSSTKTFESYPGLNLLREVAAEIGLPSFAIGGIRLDRLEQVCSTGFRRIAVSDAVWRASDPAAAARELVNRLSRVD